MDRIEAIKLVREYCPEGRSQLSEALETLIPELKESESEDEKIRKRLIEWVKEFRKLNPTNADHNAECSEAIAWLEKQGEYIKFLKSIQIGDEVTRNPDGVLVNLSQFKRKAEQGSQNLDNSSKPCKDEPKFKVGDWVVNKFGDVWHIDSFDKKNYQVSNTNGDYCYFPISKQDEMHLWTIEDAKDGDVLAEHETIVLFKKIEGLNIRCYCTYHYLGYNPTFYVGTFQNKIPYCPATKEQYDLLFQKMKEAGYEWNAEKKELNKIEQKPDPFKAEHGKYYYCIKDYFSGGKKQASKGDVVQALRGLPIMGLDDASEFFSPVNNMRLNNGINHIACPKFKVGDWVVLSSGSLSEILQIVRIDHTSNYWFNDDSYLPIVDEDCLHLWHPQDAKDGDILIEKKNKKPFIFKGLLDPSHPGYPVAYGGVDISDVFTSSSNSWWWTDEEICPATKEQRNLLFQKIKDAGYEWDAEKKELKKIEENSTWRGDDEKLINNVIELIDNGSLDRDEKDFYIEKLKSLKERVQPQWKPSKEQLTAIKHVSSEYIGSWQPEMLTLFDDLKTLYDNGNKEK